MTDLSAPIKPAALVTHEHSPGVVLRSFVIGPTAFLTVVDLFATQAILPSLARHYGVTGVLGRNMRKVQLTEPNRGGLLGMGSVLTATSLPVRTSPVVRGKWLLEVMLGEKLPPPPANAGDLPEPTKETASMTLRQRFEMHRKSPQCASCHNVRCR